MWGTLQRIIVVCLYAGFSFWTLPSLWLGSLDAWLSCNKYREANLDSSSLRSNHIPKNSRECWWPLNTFRNHQPNLGPDKYAEKVSLLTIALNAFPSPAVSCCPVTRCRGRQVDLVWQVTPHPEPPLSHVKLTLMHQQLPSYGGQNTIILKCITHVSELFPWIMLLPSPLLAGACRGKDLPRRYLYGRLGWLLSCYPYLLAVRFQTHPYISLDGPLSRWDKRHLKNTNHYAALGFPAALEMEGEEISRGQLLRLWLLISIDRIHIKGGKRA